MSIVESTIINVLNYSDSFVTVSTHIRPDGYLFQPTINDEPYAIPLSYAEIRVINSQSAIFKDGMLRFDPNIEKEVYETLGVREWETILSDSQIREIVLHPTKEGLEKLIKIMSSSMFERVRGMLVQLDNSGMYDISIRVKNTITDRYKELYVGKRISDMKIVPTLAETEKASVTEDELAKIKEELAKEIRAELLAEMKAELKQELKNESTANVVTEVQAEVVKKAAGRPAKS